MKNNMIQTAAQTLQNKRFKIGLIIAYILMVLGISATSRADVSILPYPHQGKATLMSFEGQVVGTLDGTYYLIVSNDLFFEIAPENKKIDLEQFNGLRVNVEAFELFKKVGPVLTLQTIDPLHGATKKKAAPLLLIIGISEIR